MHKSIILNKLKLLDIRTPWQVSIVKELSNRRGTSARMTPLFRDSRKRLKAVKDTTAQNKFNRAIAKLTKFGLLVEKVTATGIRVQLLASVWRLEDAIIDSISATTIALSQGRKNNINWRTILKEVRKELSNHNIKLPHKVTETLVRYFLLRRCGWKLQPDKSITSPQKVTKKLAVSYEQQQDLFSLN